MKRLALVAMLFLLHGIDAAAQDALVETIARVKPSVVGIGTFAPLRRPPAVLLGTGFAVGDGLLVATNHHVVDIEPESDERTDLVVFIGKGREVEYRPAAIVAADPEHDLAVLKIAGPALPAMSLASDEVVAEGSAIAFTGFPIGAVLGLHPVTHRGIVSAITPIAVPAGSTRELSVKRLLALRDPFDVLQLDATAYPGNSGSPVYRAESGVVVGVINQVLVKGSKENVLKDPSAITYAIPARYLATLLEQAR